MKRILAILIVLLIGFRFTASADEGMWIPMLVEELVYQEMQQMGLELSPEEIYSLNQSSLKDAIVIFGGGCTGEIISPEGLLLTNHHCGYGAIQGISTPERNLLQGGFWAKSKDEEIPIEGLRVTFLKEIKPATDKILDGVTAEMSETERDSVIRKNTNAMTEELTKDNDYRAVVRPFFEGNQYYAFMYEVFNDVRFVGAPPESIGKFGSDTDNWMWPRHTGDFSMFRVYTAPDGSPAAYSEENVPLKPKHFLPINISGVEEGDFSMIMGYPGGTDRYMTSYGVNMAINETNPTIVNIRAEKLDIMKKYMDQDSVIRLQYASKYARTANYWKYFIGQTKGLKRLKVYDKKKELEEKFTRWVNADMQRKEKYGDALKDIQEAYTEIEKTNLPRWYFREAIYSGAEIIRFSSRFSNLVDELEKDEPDQEKIDKTIEKLRETTNDYFKDYSQKVDRNMLASMLKMYYENLPSQYQPEMLKKIADKYDGNWKEYAEKVFDKSYFASRQEVMEMLDKPKAKKIKKDMAYEMMRSFFKKAREVQNATQDAQRQLERGRRLFIAGLMEMQPEKKFYPDANFTMRLSYGVVDDYYPADAVHYNYFTTLEGVMEKEDPASFEFQVPKKLKQLYEAKDYGRYGEGDTMKVCFLTNHDITGGNSGSPVINGKGELIGLAFDGNWEAMSGDIAFEPELQRTINVDIRYVLFIVDKFGGAGNLIEEMKLVKDKPKVKIGTAEKKEKAETEEAAIIE